MSDIRDLQGKIHAGTNTGIYMTVTAGDSTFQSQITGMVATGNAYDAQELTNHIGREYYRKLDQFGLTPTNKDDLDSGFRPLTFTGLYTAP
jgi:hypothetical protein